MSIVLCVVLCIAQGSMPCNFVMVIFALIHFMKMRWYLLFYIPTTCSTCVCVLLCILIVNLNCFQLFAQEEVVHIIGGGIKLLFL